MKSPSLGFIPFVLILSFVPHTLGAQTQSPPSHRWSHGTTLAVTAGVGHASDDTGAALGGAIGWEVTPRFGLKTAVTWFDNAEGANAFAASLNAHANLTASRPVSPFVEGGFGMYLASFDPKRAPSIPAFYANRMSGAGTQTFTDPAFFVNAGIDLFRHRHFSLRPAAGAVIAMSHSHAYTVGVFVVQAEYHFEDHPAGPR